MSFEKTADCLKRFSNNLATPQSGITVETSGSDTELEVSVFVDEVATPVMLIALTLDAVRVMKLPEIQKIEKYIEVPYRDQFQLISFLLPHLYSVYEGYSIPSFVSLLLNHKVEKWKDLLEFLVGEDLETVDLFTVKLWDNYIKVLPNKNKVIVTSVSDMVFEYTTSMELIQVLLEVLSYIYLIKDKEPEIFETVVLDKPDDDESDTQDIVTNNTYDIDFSMEDREEPFTESELEQYDTTSEESEFETAEEESEPESAI